jgi:uncharacterized membrane protein (UPF0127 family)
MRGLQWRLSLPENHGMFFCFPREGILTFHMLDTPLSLDLLFFDHKGTLVGYIEHAAPWSPEHLSIPVAAQYVLEIHAGWLRRHHLHLGDRILGALPCVP